MSSFEFGPCFLMSLLYMFLTIAEGFQIARIIYYRHNFLSFQNGFLIICCTWGIARWLYFLLQCTKYSDPTSVLYLYWLTFNLQFATFSLLVLFFAQVVHKSARWENLSIYIYTLINVLFFVIMIVFLSVNSIPGYVLNCCVGTMFLVLVLVLAYYGCRVANLLRSANLLAPLFPKGDSPASIIGVTMIIFLIYVSRCTYDFLSAFDSSFGLVLQNQCDYGKKNILFCMVFLVWEITPTFLVLLLFWRIPKTKVRILGKTSNGYSPVPLNSVNDYPPSTSLFDNPFRYDSSTEETSQSTNNYTAYPIS